MLVAMAKKTKGPGSRRNIHVRTRHEVLWDQLENRSAFVAMALDQAAGIITWALMQAENPEKYKLDETPTAEEIAAFNEAFPADPLTQKRRLSSQNSAPPPEIW